MRFRRYALERIVATIGVLFLAVVVVFVICHVVGPVPLQRGSTRWWAASYSHYAHESFGDYLWRLVGHGSFGRPWHLDPFTVAENPGARSLDAALVTLSLVGWALFFGLLVAVPLGLAWDRRPRWTRAPAALFVYLAISALSIWIGFYAIVELSAKRNIFPQGYADFFSPRPGAPGGPVQWAYHLILPALVLSLPVAAIYTRVVRALARNVRRAASQAEPSERAEALRHARATALVVFFKGLLRDIGLLMGAAAFVEVVFGLPGFGLTLVGTSVRYMPVMEGVLIVATLIAVVIHLAGNLIGGAFSRQWRLGS